MSSEEIQRYDNLMAKCERESAETLRLLDTMKEQVAECRRTVAETQRHITRVIDLMEMTARASLANSQRIDALEKRVPPLVLESAVIESRKCTCRGFSMGSDCPVHSNSFDNNQPLNQ